MIISKPNLSKLLKPFENKWVALSSDYKKVISNGDTFKKVMGEIKSEEKDKVVIFKVLPAGYEPVVN